MAFPHSRTFDDTDPADGNLAKTLGEEIREFKEDVEERMDISFSWASTTTGGEAMQLRFQEVAAPTLAATKGFLYVKDVSGATELFYMDAAGTEFQITDNGSLAILKEHLLLDELVHLRGAKSGGTQRDLAHVTASGNTRLGNTSETTEIQVETAPGPRFDTLLAKDPTGTQNILVSDSVFPLTASRGELVMRDDAGTGWEARSLHRVYARKTDGNQEISSSAEEDIDDLTAILIPGTDGTRKYMVNITLTVDDTMEFGFVYQGTNGDKSDTSTAHVARLGFDDNSSSSNSLLRSASFEITPASGTQRIGVTAKASTSSTFVRGEAPAAGNSNLSCIEVVEVV